MFASVFGCVGFNILECITPCYESALSGAVTMTAVPISETASTHKGDRQRAKRLRQTQSNPDPDDAKSVLTLPAKAAVGSISAGTVGTGEPAA